MSANKHTNAAAPYGVAEEIANALSHGLSMAAAIVATTLLLVKGMPTLSTGQLTGVAIYGASLILLFLSSTLYHSITHAPSKAALKRLDHCAIYLLIAGTYTPLLTITLAHSAYAQIMLVVIWALAFAGILFKIFLIHRFKKLSLITYLLMGWISLVLINELWASLARPGFWLLIAGGLCFTVGAGFYAAKQVRYTHAIWHVFVAAGAACHCVLIGLYVLP
jgi:hemolysin III